MLFAVFVCQKENENVICISPLSLFLQQTACKESIRVHCPPVATTMASEVKSPFFEASWQYMKVLSTAFFHHVIVHHVIVHHVICHLLFVNKSVCDRFASFFSSVIPVGMSSRTRILRHIPYLPISIRIPHIGTMRQSASPSFQTSKSKDKYQPLRPKLYHQLLLPVFSPLPIL